jgi:hypothetical protein
MQQTATLLCVVSLLFLSRCDVILYKKEQIEVKSSLSLCIILCHFLNEPQQGLTWSGKQMIATIFANELIIVLYSGGAIIMQMTLYYSKHQ